MTETNPVQLRRGWTTGACATAATCAAVHHLWGGAFPDKVSITLPKGEMPEFDLEVAHHGQGWAEVGVIKDAGDDPDVTHGALILSHVRTGTAGQGIRFLAGEGVGIVTKPGLPVPPGEPAINPVPRRMITEVIEAAARQFNHVPDLDVTISVRGGADLAQKTWNPRLGIVGGLSILGTTGVVRPFSCAAWIASIHRGVDVARATGLPHVAGCTGATSEATVQSLYGLSDGAMIDMGDFAGGMLKYLAKHPVGRVTVGGGIGKITKLAQGARDLHSRRSQVDFDLLADWLGDEDVRGMNTALQVYEKHGKMMVDVVAGKALAQVRHILRNTDCVVDIVMIDRPGNIIAQVGG
ncbi:cobalt-precorrin-5B (C(1))-methyltransferase [Aliiroseovarius crassostreae]|uniref:Cobalt-precorrin-5B C(1)-methyltransferase n=1 Tax=Aliiroseovarius crassostreae TaxID=154981 RepID=A0A9Q9H787_9RHOB|nr:cobalt-precorrin-5B (C(1))-methyltransferase [Aliiroseovarius crassostreae]UWP93626.1 cobalt-precorrin-5B (C(1))-methyltransferase [Aliiroseovarius crassostreae]UWP94123.1 cobalt-precorrin-5B (C(1))-methyltransferase [Aliiroseovarius crassostreae]